MGLVFCLWSFGLRVNVRKTQKVMAFVPLMEPPGVPSCPALPLGVHFGYHLGLQCAVAGFHRCRWDHPGPLGPLGSPTGS